MEPDAIARRGRRMTVSYSAIAPLLAVADVPIILFASVLGGVVYQLAISGSAGDVAGFAGMGLLSSLAYGLCARHFELYRLQTLLHGRRQYWRIVACIGFALLFVTVILFLLKVGNQYSRGSVICFITLATTLLIGWRIVLKDRLKKALAAGAISGRRALIVGHESELAGLTKDLLLIGCGLEEAGRVELPPVNGGMESKCDAAIDRAIEAARITSADEILVCVSWGDASQLNMLRERLRVVPLPVRLFPDRFVRSLWGHGDAFAGVNLIEIQRAPLTLAEQWVKRLFDLAVAGVTLVMLLPLMILTAVALKLEGGGPIIFRQRRRGFNGREFEIYKFRTMTVLEDGTAIRQAERHDTRVTAIGRVLRRTSIDELPQLFNVLQGQMSIVGPRPHAVAHDEEYAALIGNYAFRRHMKPGITGWAQINGLRGATPRLEQMQRRIEQDLWYIDNWSPLLDMAILVRTCGEFLMPRNAY